MNSNGKDKKWFIVIEIFLGVILLFNLLVLVNMIHNDTTPFFYDDYDMEWVVAENNYPKLLNMLEENEIVGVELSADREEYQAIADFDESAMMYYGYKKVGDTENAKKYQLQMEAAREKLTTDKFIKAAEEIQEKYKEISEDETWIKEKKK